MTLTAFILILMNMRRRYVMKVLDKADSYVLNILLHFIFLHGICRLDMFTHGLSHGHMNTHSLHLSLSISLLLVNLTYQLLISYPQEECMACSQVPQNLEVRLTDKLKDIITMLTESFKFQVGFGLCSCPYYE